MSDLKAKEKASSDKLDRIEERNAKTAALNAKTAILIAENARVIAENAKGIAENAKGIAELKENTASLEMNLDAAMKWVPIKTGLWTVGLLLSLLVVLAKVPYALSVIMFLIGRG